MNELIAWAVAVVVALGGAWAMGRRSGAAKQVKKEYEMMKEASKIEEKHDQKTDSDVRTNSTKWVRRNG